MSLSTKDKATALQDKKQKIKLLRDFHQETLNSLGVPNAVFIPKMAYKPHGKTEKHIGFFPSEIKGEDIYVEFTSKELEPEDPERKLYKWRFNPHYDAEYDRTEVTEQMPQFRYLIPVEELLIIPPVKRSRKPAVFDLPEADKDLPMDQMTLRDYAAIHLKKAVSFKPWLNEIISKK